MLKGYGFFGTDLRGVPRCRMGRSSPGNNVFFGEEQSPRLKGNNTVHDFASNGNDAVVYTNAVWSAGIEVFKSD